MKKQKNITGSHGLADNWAVVNQLKKEYSHFQAKWVAYKLNK